MPKIVSVRQPAKTFVVTSGEKMPLHRTVVKYFDRNQGCLKATKHGCPVNVDYIIDARNVYKNVKWNFESLSHPIVRARTNVRRKVTIIIDPDIGTVNKIEPTRIVRGVRWRYSFFV